VAERSIRRQCLDLLQDIVGAEGVPRFLRSRQPDMEDKTGSELLNREPERLLLHLKSLERQLAGDRFDYEDGFDPIILDRPPARRSEKDASRVLGLLDEIFGEGGESS